MNEKQRKPYIVAYADTHTHTHTIFLAKAL